MIQFKDVRAGHVVHLLDKDKLEYKAVKVDSVREPYFATNAAQPQRMVDVTMTVDGRQRTFVIPETACVTYADKLMLATEKQQVTLEVQSVRGTAEAAVKAYEANVEIIGKCDKVLEVLDESIAEKRETERRFASLEAKIQELLNKLG